MNKDTNVSTYYLAPCGYTVAVRMEDALSFVNLFKNHTSFIIGQGNSFLNDMWKSNWSLSAVFPSIYNVFSMIEFVFLIIWD